MSRGRLALLAALLWPAELLAQSGAAVEIERRPWRLHPSLEFGGELALEAAWIDGGPRPGTSTLANLDLLLDVDTERAGWWRGGTLHFYLLADAGASPAPSERAGDIQGLRNLEAPEDWKLYEAYLEQRLGERATVAVGLHDMNTVFVDVETAALFHHSSFGIQPDVSQVGVSNFPATTLGVALVADLRADLLLEAGAYDGVPGDPALRRGTRVHLTPREGLYAIAQLTRRIGGGIRKGGGDWAVGGWHHTAPVTTAAGELHDNTGVFSTYEQRLWGAPGGGGALFAQAGWARADRNSIARYLGAGLVWTGAFPGRPQDRLGFAAGRASLSAAHRSANPGLPRAETVLECLYSLQFSESLALEPGLQWIWNPAATAGASRAAVLALRVVTQF